MTAYDVEPDSLPPGHGEKVTPLPVAAEESEQETISDEEARQLAREAWASDDLEIDEDAKVSHAEDTTGPSGAWVAAWVWVDAP
jgi:hypothetical protein